jgi:hypothetical protein
MSYYTQAVCSGQCVSNYATLLVRGETFFTLAPDSGV